MTKRHGAKPLYGFRPELLRNDSMLSLGFRIERVQVGAQILYPDLAR